MIMYADLHCHTRCSDGSLSAVEVVSYAAEQGVNVLAITDHDSIGGWVPADRAAQEVSRVKGKNLIIIPGVEINTSWLDREIHILGYFDPRFLSSRDSKDMEEELVENERQGRGSQCLWRGAAVLAHPKDMKQEVIEELVEAGLAGLEVWHPDHNTSQMEELQRIARYYGILVTGGSDYHGFGLHAELGCFGVDEGTVDRLRQRLAEVYNYCS